jgi:DNA-binding NtrC family response regulator
MGEPHPSVLILDRDGKRRARIAAVLREAGFNVTGFARRGEALAVLTTGRCDLAIIAGARPDGSDLAVFARQAGLHHKGGKLLLLAPSDAAYARAASDHGDVARLPLDPQRLTAIARKMVTAGEEASRGEAEFGLIEAQLACLFNRHALAEQSGAGDLARAIVQQIGHAVAARRALMRTGVIAANRP